MKDIFLASKGLPPDMKKDLRETLLHVLSILCKCQYGMSANISSCAVFTFFLKNGGA